MKTVGTMSIGVKTPIIRQGDDLPSIVVQSVLQATAELGLGLENRDVISITEAVVARSQGNYATTTQIASDIRAKTGGKRVGLLFPILSRNRFSSLLRAAAAACEEIVIQFSYPNDEVGNPLIPQTILDEKANGSLDVSYSEEEFTSLFGAPVHIFTGVNYLQYYKDLCKGISCKIVFSNHPEHILTYADTVIACDIHSRQRTKDILLKKGARKVFTLADFLTQSVGGSGYNPQFGLLGSNLATENSVKLFPRDAEKIVLEVQRQICEKTGKNVEVMVYGDGGFKDPVGGIWEFADPVVSPAFTSGLLGNPDELKFKYLADTALANLRGKEAEDAMKTLIKRKNSADHGGFNRQGTTPRRLTDLLGSLSDLTSGSGDKGTPVVLIKNYFTNYAE